jgi:hypothetical protein
MSDRRSIRIVAMGGIAAATLAMTAPLVAQAATDVAEPAELTSAFVVTATPDQVVSNDGVVTPGEEGATGRFEYRVNVDEEIICFSIRLTGVTGDYQSPATTATHIHEAEAGQPGPPRIAFPNPVDDGSGVRVSEGCLQGPFTTGVLDAQGVDTGEGFSLAALEANPAGFTSDAHTTAFPAGVVRGQLAQGAIEVDEPEAFTSTLSVTATPDEVIASDGSAAPGQTGASGDFRFRIAADEEIICYAITLTGVTGEYQSPAITATHVHEAAAGAAGPPRIAFPNPEGTGDERTSEGCLQGPFATGVLGPDGVDTGTGFSLAQIEADPAAFTGDSHTVDFVPGVVRGQLEEVATESASPEPTASEAAPESAVAEDGEAGAPVGLVVAIVAALAILALVAVVVIRRRGARG